MSLADEIRERRGDRDDPFDQVAARREFRRAKAPERAESEQAARDELDQGNARRESFKRRGRQAASGGRRVASNAAMVATGARRPINIAGEGAGLVLGVIGYALVLNYVRGGPAAMVGWVKSKFLNEPYTANLAATGKPGAVTPATPPAYPQATGRASAPLEHSVPSPPYAPTVPGSADFTQTPPLPRGA